MTGYQVIDSTNWCQEDGSLHFTRHLETLKYDSQKRKLAIGTSVCCVFINSFFFSLKESVKLLYSSLWFHIQHQHSLRTRIVDTSMTSRADFSSRAWHSFITDHPPIYNIPTFVINYANYLIWTVLSITLCFLQIQFNLLLIVTNGNKIKSFRKSYIWCTSTIWYILCYSHVSQQSWPCHAYS